MSSTGGGHIILAHHSINWVSQDLSQSIQFINDTNTDTSITDTEAQAFATQYIPDGGSITLTWNGTSWSQ